MVTGNQIWVHEIDSNGIQWHFWEWLTIDYFWFEDPCDFFGQSLSVS